MILDALSKSGGKEKMLVAIDPNQSQNSKALSFFDKAGFNGLYKIVTSSSESNDAQNSAMQNSPYDIIYIDSLHDYGQITKELQIYFKMLRKGGLLFCHDSSEFATQFDTKKEGGVRKGLKEFIEKNPIEGIFLEEEEGWHVAGLFLGKKS